MKGLFFAGLLGLVAFEILNVSFIMPFPGSQNGGTLALAEAGRQLKPIAAYQEFWHSWRTFHPETARHE